MYDLLVGEEFVEVEGGVDVYSAGVDAGVVD